MPKIETSTVAALFAWVACDISEKADEGRQMRTGTLWDYLKDLTRENSEHRADIAAVIEAVQSARAEDEDAIHYASTYYELGEPHNGLRSHWSTSHTLCGMLHEHSPPDRLPEPTCRTSENPESVTCPACAVLLRRWAWIRSGYWRGEGRGSDQGTFRANPRSDLGPCCQHLGDDT